MSHAKLNMALIFGGRSVEHDISVLSAKNVYSHLNHDNYHVVLLGIDQQGGWHHCTSPDQPIADGHPVALVLEGGKGVFRNLTTQENLPVFDVAFPVLHGTDGEDGSVQGLLQVASIPYLGSGVLGSSLAMSKTYSKKLLQQAGVPITRYATYTKAQSQGLTYQQVAKALGSQSMILKPANLGSSVGVAKVTNQATFEQALANAFAYDVEVIFEEFVTGREMEIAVMGNDQPQASAPGEVVVTGNHEFYSFDAKYVDANGAKIIMPAPIDDAEVVAQIQALAVASYVALGCEDFARVDLFLTADNQVYINEINTIPGFTNISMFPKLWQLQGIEYAPLIDRLVGLCLKQYNATVQRNTNFESELS